MKIDSHFTLSCGKKHGMVTILLLIAVHSLSAQIPKLEIEDSSQATILVNSLANENATLELINSSDGDPVSRWQLIHNSAGNLQFKRGMHLSAKAGAIFKDDGTFGFGTFNPSADFDFRIDNHDQVRLQVLSTKLGSSPSLDLISGIPGFHTRDWRMGIFDNDLVFMTGVNQFNTDSSAVMHLNTDGFVGISAPNPKTRLHVRNGTDIDLAGGGVLTLGSVNSWHLSFDNDEIQSSGANGPRQLAIQDLGGDLHLVNGGGLVGVGTNAPKTKMHIRGGTSADKSSGGFLMLGNEESQHVAYDNQQIQSRRGGNYNSLSIQKNGGNLFLVNGGGYTGIGTDDPRTKLHIRGGVDLDLVQGGFLMMGNLKSLNLVLDDNEIQGRNNYGHSPLALQNSGGDLHLVNGGGRMGIGTNLPGYGVHIKNRDIALSDAADQELLIMTQSSGEGGKMFLYDASGNLRIEMEAAENNSQGAQIAMRNAEGEETIWIDSDFDDRGRITLDELEIKGGADLSEQFTIGDGQTILPGTVVSIDPDHAGQLKICEETYDQKVAGIISGANGIRSGLLMGQSGSIADGDYPVALTGRVYVRANKENGSIQPGDLITTSSTPGEAMKVKKQRKARGAILGKAMTEIDSTGLVLVLVNLQ